VSTAPCCDLIYLSKVLTRRMTSTLTPPGRGIRAAVGVARARTDADKLARLLCARRRKPARRCPCGAGEAAVARVDKVEREFFNPFIVGRGRTAPLWLYYMSGLHERAGAAG
jgi:hypothetical protein